LNSSIIAGTVVRTVEYDTRIAVGWVWTRIRRGLEEFRAVRDIVEGKDEAMMKEGFIGLVLNG
jgi:hypothetical protein